MPGGPIGHFPVRLPLLPRLPQLGALFFVLDSLSPVRMMVPRKIVRLWTLHTAYTTPSCLWETALPSHEPRTRQWTILLIALIAEVYRPNAGVFV